MDEQRLKILLKNCLKTNNSESFSTFLVDFLVEKLSFEMRMEIDKQINRLSPSLHLLNENNNNLQVGTSMDLWFTETETKNLNEFNKSFGLLQSIAFNLVNNSNIYKKFHFKIIKICSQMAKTEKETRRRSSSFSMESFALPRQWSFHSFSSTYANDSQSKQIGEAQEEEETQQLALSGFSLLDNSVKDLPEEEICSIIELIVADDLEIGARKANMRKLLFVSPLTLSRSKAFELFLGNLHSLLLVPALFDDTMSVIGRILNCRDAVIWQKTSICLCRVALNVMRKNALSKSAKCNLAYFFSQIFSNGPYIWRNFDIQSLTQIVQSYMELLTSETDSSKGGLNSGNSFLNTLAKAEPSAEWLMNWLYDYQLRPLATPRLAEMIVEILDKSEQNTSKTDPTQQQTFNLWLFQFCLILRCLRVPSFQEFLLETVPSPSKFEECFCNKIIYFLNLALTIPSNNRERKIFVDELLATSMSDCSAKLIISSSLLNEIFNLMITKLNQKISIQFESLPLKLLLNIFSHCEITFKLIPKLNSTKIIEYIKYFSTKIMKKQLFTSSLGNTNPFELRELCINVLILLIEKCSLNTEIGHIMSDQLQNLISTLIPNPDPSITSHKHLLLSPCFLKSQSFGQLKICRKKLGKIIYQFWLKQKETDSKNNSILLNFPISVRPMDEEQWRGASKLLKKFLFVNSDFGGDEEINEEEEFNENYYIPQHEGLNFLPNNEEISSFSLSIFVLATQPSLLIEIIKILTFLIYYKENFLNLKIKRRIQQKRN
uniref:Uncharacterized protein n=1 Tax=Meloidogyne enterolobii TaxID=390850 RepID=A0A6V7W419_MELEN|nr:unnamed protein product [Meloidogyne enterolobii]